MPHAKPIAEQIFFAPPETENFHPITESIEAAGETRINRRGDRTAGSRAGGPTNERPGYDKPVL
jgi:hypothetical protein